MALSSPATRSPGLSGGLDLSPHCCLVGRLGLLTAVLTSSFPSRPVLSRPAVSWSEPYTLLPSMKEVMLLNCCLSSSRPHLLSDLVKEWHCRPAAE